MGNIQFSNATVSANGLRFNGRIYSNSAMIHTKWFEHAEKNGEWVIPIVYDSNKASYIALFDVISFEVASSVDNNNEDINELLLFFSAIQDLKEILRGHPRRK